MHEMRVFYLNRVQQYFEDEAVSSGDERLYMEATCLKAVVAVVGEC